jgi:hypothetical protein
VIGIVLFGVVLLAMGVMVLGGGQHGPGMHTGTGAAQSPSLTSDARSAHYGAGTFGQVTVG